MAESSPHLEQFLLAMGGGTQAGETGRKPGSGYEIENEKVCRPPLFFRSAVSPRLLVPTARGRRRRGVPRRSREGVQRVVLHRPYEELPRPPPLLGGVRRAPPAPEPGRRRRRRGRDPAAVPPVLPAVRPGRLAARLLGQRDSELVAPPGQPDPDLRTEPVHVDLRPELGVNVPPTLDRDEPRLLGEVVLPRGPVAQDEELRERDLPEGRRSVPAAGRRGGRAPPHRGGRAVVPRRGVVVGLGLVRYDLFGEPRGGIPRVLLPEEAAEGAEGRTLLVVEAPDCPLDRRRGTPESLEVVPEPVGGVEAVREVPPGAARERLEEVQRDHRRQHRGRVRREAHVQERVDEQQRELQHGPDDGRRDPPRDRIPKLGQERHLEEGLVALQPVLALEVPPSKISGDVAPDPQPEGGRQDRRADVPPGPEPRQERPGEARREDRRVVGSPPALPVHRAGLAVEQCRLGRQVGVAAVVPPGLLLLGGGLEGGDGLHGVGRGARVLRVAPRGGSRGGRRGRRRGGEGGGDDQGGRDFHRRDVCPTRDRPSAGCGPTARFTH
ncbi:hypothetical protein THAOC_19261, partial [Thalassiosira oceanica]